MGFIRKIQDFYAMAKEAGIKNTVPAFAESAWLSYRFHIPMKYYFAFALYQKENKAEFLKHNNRYTRQWGYTCDQFFPSAGSLWRTFHYLEYIFMKAVYPGLDGRDYFQYQFHNFRHAVRKTFVTEGYLKKINSYFNGGPECRDEDHLLGNKELFYAKFPHIIIENGYMSMRLRKGSL